MRIAYVCLDPGVPVFGHKGCSIHVQEMLRAFQQLGAEVELFATRWGSETPPDLAGIPTHCLRPANTTPFVSREQQQLESNRRLADRLDAAGPFDLVYERHSLFSDAATWLARRGGLPGVLEVNAPLVEEQSQHRHLLNIAMARQLAVSAFFAASSIVAVSDQVADYVARHTNRVDRIHVVPNGVNPNAYRPRRNSPNRGPAASWTIGFVGSLKPWHGVQALVEAFSVLYRQDRTYRLLIVGDGPQREAIERQIAAKRIEDAVLLTGAVPHAAVPDLLQWMDVAVAPYPALTDFYFSPLKVFEYMAAGLPVVASRLGQVSQVIDDGVNGLLCAPGDVDDLAATIARLRHSPELCDMLGRHARQSVEAEYTWQHVARRILDAAGAAALSPAHHERSRKLAGPLPDPSAAVSLGAFTRADLPEDARLR